MFKFLRRWSNGSSRAHKRLAKICKPYSRLRLEALEDRFAPAVFNVNSLADILSPPAGVVTLRSAIEAANAGTATVNASMTSPEANASAASTGCGSVNVT
jgi:hypothetical protein